MENPDPIAHICSMLAKIQLHTIAIIRTIRTDLITFAGGKMIAINMPYIAIPSASRTPSGKMEEANPPKNVPIVQQKIGSPINPHI